jgi:hypothetical protein
MQIKLRKKSIFHFLNEWCSWYFIVKAMLELKHRKIRDLGSAANYFVNLIMVNDILKQCYSVFRFSFLGAK